MDELSIRDLLDPETIHAVTRAVGKAIFPKLAEHVRRASEGEVVRVLVPGGLLMDYSFADETFGQLYSDLVEGNLGDRYVLTAVSTEAQLDNLVACIKLRSLSAVLLFQGEYRLVDPPRGADELRETFDLVNQYGSVTAPELAEHHRLGVTTWNNRLVRASNMRIIARHQESAQNGGRLYVYESLLSR